MAQDVATLAIKVESKGVKAADKDLEGLERQSVKTERELADLDRQSKKMNKTASAMGKAFGTVVGTLATGLFARSVINNTIEQEKAIAQLEATLKSTGRSSESLSKDMQDFASSLQEVTTFGDEAVIASQALLLTFTQIGGDAFPRAQRAILDVATAMGTDLQSATLQVGKALNDPILGMTALSRSGIQFTQAQKDVVKQMVETGNAAGAQEIILKELEVQFGGSAAAARNTLGGAIESLKNNFGDLLEGDSGGEGVNGATSAINNLSDTMASPEVKAAFGTITSAVILLLEKSAAATVAFTNFGTAIGEWAGRLAVGPADAMEQVNLELENSRAILKNIGGELNTARILRVNPFASTSDLEKDWQVTSNRIKELERIKADFEANPIKVVPGSSVSAPLPNVPVSASDQGASKASTEASDKAAKAAQSATDAINNQITSLKIQADTVGLSSTAVTLHKLALEGATPAQLALAAAALETVDAYKLEQEQLETIAALKRDMAAEQESVNMQAASIIESLLVEEEAIQLSYERRREIILAATMETETQRTAILEQLEADRNEKLVAIEQERTAKIFELNQQFFGGLAGLAKAYAGEQSGIYRALFAVEQGFAVAKALLAVPESYQKAFNAVVGIPFVGPALAPAAGTAAAALSVAQVGMMRSVSPSFDGGGYTGNGSRSGGLDGKGGFMALMHPQETVTDHTKGQTPPRSGGEINNTFILQGRPDIRTQQQLSQKAATAQRTVNARFGQ